MELIKVEYLPGVTKVVFDDWYIFKETQIEQLKQLLMPLAENTKQGCLALDFAKVESIASSFLGLLVILHKKMREQGGNMELWNLCQNIQKVFEITQLTKVFKICKK
jgi:anti-anti-sigma factor